MSQNNIISENANFSFKIPQDQAGIRIDLFLTIHLPQFSRTIIKKWLMNQQVIINQTTPAKPSYIIKSNDTITLLSIPTPTTRDFQEVHPHLGVKIIAQHNDFLIINKPAGLVVHPPQQTFTEISLVDWLVQNFPTIKDVGEATRPGIVHRLDSDTSGIMIVALTQQAHTTFSALFKDRKIQKTYLALVTGHPQQSGTITYPIARHPAQKNIMHCFTGIVENSTARDAQTDYQVLQYFDTFSLVEIKPKTGRTHQIRIHFKAIGHPLLGDEVYGKSSKLIAYHALHAQKLEFEYQGKLYQFESPLDLVLENIIKSSQKTS